MDLIWKLNLAEKRWSFNIIRIFVPAKYVYKYFRNNISFSNSIYIGRFSCVGIEFGWKIFWSGINGSPKMQYISKLKMCTKPVLQTQKNCRNFATFLPSVDTFNGRKELARSNLLVQTYSSHHREAQCVKTSVHWCRQ